MSNTLPNSNLIAAAVGATIGVVSVAAVFIYHRVMERQQHTAMNRNIDKVNRKVVELQAELEELRTQQANLQKSRRKRLAKRQACSPDNTLTDDVDIDTYSTAGTDVGDDEFYDCSDEEAIDLENETLEGTMNNDAMFLEIDENFEDHTLHSALYKKLKKLYIENPNDIEIIWRFARACYYCSVPVKKSEKEKEFVYEGLAACEKVLDISHGDLYKWYAILVGTKSQFLPTKGKIENGYLFKDYVDKAIKIKPQDNYLYHLMGRFKYEVSELSWIERKVASTLFAEVPQATYEDAISCFETAEKLSEKPHYENTLFLGKTYIALSKYREAVFWLSKLEEIPTDSEENKQILKEAKKLLQKYSGYRT